MQMPIIILTGKAGSGKDTVAEFMVRGSGAVAIAQADPLKRFAYNVLRFTEHQLWGPSEARNAVDARNPAEIVGCFDSNAAAAASWSVDIGLRGVPYKLADWFDTYVRNLTMITPRYVLQTLGTEFGRALNPNIWVDYAQRMATKLLTEGGAYDRTRGHIPCKTRPTFVVITDGRFANEILATKSRGGLAIKIVNPHGSGLTGTAGEHASETEMDGIPEGWFNVIVENNKADGLGYLKATVEDLVKDLTRSHTYTTSEPTLRVRG